MKDFVSNYDKTTRNGRAVKKTQFDETSVVQKTIQLTRESYYPISFLTDTTSSVQGGTIVNNTPTGEYYFSTTSNPASYISLTTNTRGEYVAGTEAEASMGIRLSNTITGAGYARWGYYDTNDGFGWEYDAGGLKAFMLKSGSFTYISQSQFSEDKLDGTGPSRFSDANLVLTGSVYAINFAWYGYGDAYWNMLRTKHDIPFYNEETNVQTLHIENQSRGPGTKITNPNLPLRIELFNDGGTDPLGLYVGGRQFSIYGAVNTPRARFIDVVENWTLTSSANQWEPIFAMRRNASYPAFPNIILKTVDFTASQKASFKVTVHDNDDGASTFLPPESYNSTNSGVVVAKTGSISGTYGGHLNGFRVPPYIVVDTAGVGSGVSFQESSNVNSDVTLPDNKTLIVWAKHVGTPPSISAVINWYETR